jgi:peptidylprolyl isomerase
MVAAPRTGGHSEQKGAELRTALSVVIVLGLVGTLAACSPAGDTTASDCTPTASGKASEKVTVTGDFGSKPTVEFGDPLTTTTTQRSVVIEGDGEIAQSGDNVTLDFTIYNGTTGEEIEGGGTSYNDDPAAFTLDENLIAGFNKTVECSPVGSRVVGVLSPEDGIIGESLEQLGLTEEDSVVLVADVVSTETPAAATEVLPKADGEDQELPDGFPDITVDLAEDGTPTLTLPDTEAPTELEIAVLKKGDGPEVGTAADVVVHYTGVKWSDKTVFDSSWERGEPTTFNTSGVIPGFTQALEGQTVGSQVLVVIPPSLAYGTTEEGSTHELVDQTLVFIIDIVGLG